MNMTKTPMREGQAMVERDWRYLTWAEMTPRERALYEAELPSDNEELMRRVTELEARIAAARSELVITIASGRSVQQLAEMIDRADRVLAHPLPEYERISINP
jgi:hypothetical protein